MIRQQPTLFVDTDFVNDVRLDRYIANVISITCFYCNSLKGVIREKKDISTIFGIVEKKKSVKILI